MNEQKERESGKRQRKIDRARKRQTDRQPDIQTEREREREREGREKEGQNYTVREGRIGTTGQHYLGLSKEGDNMDRI